MLRKLGIIILHCIVTAIIVGCILQLKELPPYYWTTFAFISYGMAFIVLLLAFWQWKKIGPYTKRAWMSEYPIAFSTDKIDCYVRFTGKIASEKAHRLPLSNSECVFYVATVVTEWQTKKKKPDSGMETQRKTLLREQSADELRLDDRGHSIYIKTEDFSSNRLELRKREETQGKCPPQLADKAKSKYTTYRLLERYLEDGDTVAVQGRLARNADGRLFIKPTRRLDFPSFVVIKEQLAQLTDTIAVTARQEAWDKSINAGFLLINALVLCLLWL